jgi:2-C-methyl-D-erythritol 2,4-cyclodiphosphate synthase
MDERRVGLGYDVHRFDPKRPLVLGGVRIPHDRGLLGHSDADVLTHAICDALLGAAGLGDIGTHFPDTDEAYRGISSLELLRRVVGMLRETGFRVVNVDATVIAEEPKLAAHFPPMRERLSEPLGVPAACIGLKATTNEGLGALGRAEGIAAIAVCLIGRATPDPCT